MVLQPPRQPIDLSDALRALTVNPHARRLYADPATPLSQEIAAKARHALSAVGHAAPAQRTSAEGNLAAAMQEIFAAARETDRTQYRPVEEIATTLRVKPLLEASLAKLTEGGAPHGRVVSLIRQTEAAERTYRNQIAEADARRERNTGPGYDWNDFE